MKRLIFTALMAVLFGSLSAQNDMVSRLKQQNYGDGSVTLTQDARLDKLIGGGAASGHDDHLMKVQGFRIQVYAGNNSGSARNEAHAMGDKVKQLFPELSVYTNFISPRWICRVGDFRSIEEADAVMRQLKEAGSFKEVSIVRVQINVSY